MYNAYCSDLLYLFLEGSECRCKQVSDVIDPRSWHMNLQVPLFFDSDDMPGEMDGRRASQRRFEGPFRHSHLSPIT